MAGRPVGSRGGLSGAHWGMISFAFVSVLCLGAFILQLTKVKEAEGRAATLQAQLARQGTPEDYFATEATNLGSNVFEVMRDQLKALAKLAAGQPDASAPVIEAQVNKVLADVAARKPGTINAGDTLLTAVEKLDRLHDEERAKAQAAADIVEDTQKEVESLTAQLKSTRDEFTQQTAALGEQLKQVEQEKAKQIGEKDKQLADVQNVLDAREQQLQQIKREGLQTVREKDVEIARLNVQLAQARDQVKILKPSSYDPDTILTKADGRILRAIPGSDVVYIDLGSNDKIKVGMGFEIFSQTREAPRGLRGKASIEVLTVMEDTAECRVLRASPGQPIIEGDIAVNIAYERGRKPKFVVQGDFDLNYDGVVDFDGYDKVASIIRQWGGQVVDDVDESVDFVIIGLQPLPAAIGEGATQVSDVVREQVIIREIEASRFKAVFDAARARGVPVLTQNHFLYLTGYTGDTTIVRR